MIAEWVGNGVIAFFLYNSAEYFLHMLGHWRHPWNWVYSLHITHHKDHYPITDLQSDVYRGRNEGVIAFLPVFGLSEVILLWNAYYEISGLMIIFLVVSEYIHTQTHLKESWLDRFEWFQKQRQRHFKHHRKLTKNLSFAGLSYTMDKWMGTYEE
jgi:sterol desaturase/sphingolipid hydroxylase (fatty acid hydroxylase superfamily)